MTLARRRWAISVMALLALGAVVAACGGGDSGNEETPTSVVTVSATRTPAASPTVAGATATVEASAPTAAAPTQPPVAQPTQRPPQPPTTAPPPPPPPTQAPPSVLNYTIVAKDLTFSQTSLAATAGATVNITMDNQDVDVAHDIQIFAGGSVAARTETIIGPGTSSLTFTPAAPGNYLFNCSVHPDDMQGVIRVQ